MSDGARMGWMKDGVRLSPRIPVLGRGLTTETGGGVGMIVIASIRERMDKHREEQGEG
jgi:hypothetical protein